jgi:hypothetical protein
MNTDEHTVLSIIDEMLEYLDADGIIQVSGTVCSLGAYVLNILPR